MRGAFRGSCCTDSTRRCSSPTPTTSASACACSPCPGETNWVVVAAEPITDIDATAGETLRTLDDELEADGIELAFAELKDPVRDRLRHYGIHDTIGDHRYFPTLGVAVDTYLRETGVDWTDWADRPLER